jgi:CRP-like cAMP-binding protein
VSIDPAENLRYGLGTRSTRERFERLTRAFVKESPLFQGLPRGMQQDLFDMGVSRTFSRGTMLRGMTHGTTVHVILRWCGIERSAYLDGASLQFRGVGAVLGDTDIFYEDSVPSTAECLDQTWTLSYSLERMKQLADADTTLMRNLTTGIAMQLRTAEKVFASSKRSPVERVAALLVELSSSCGTLIDYKDLEAAASHILGPTQNELAEALLMSRASVENALRALRNAQIIFTSYRRYIVLDLQKLIEVAKGTLTLDVPYAKPNRA